MPAWNPVIGIACIASGIAAMIFNIYAITTKRLKHGEIKQRGWIALLVPVIACGFVIAGASTNWFDPFYSARIPTRGEAPPVQFTFWRVFPGGDRFVISFPVLKSLHQDLHYSPFPSCHVMRTPAPHRGQ